MKPFAAAAEQNREVILAAIEPLLKDKTAVLEIGSGTGQHAVHFAAAMPWLRWQCSDLAENLPGILMWLDEAGLTNTPAPRVLDALQGPWPEAGYDAAYSCNTAHIMSWPQVEAMFSGVAEALDAGGVFLIYGPFNYGGQYTSESNRRFDAMLQQQDSQSGIRDKDDLDRIARKLGLEPAVDIAMPSNNRVLGWNKIE